MKNPGKLIRRAYTSLVRPRVICRRDTHFSVISYRSFKTTIDIEMRIDDLITPLRFTDAFAIESELHNL